jgi:Ni/Co efflux regulator RcnB
MRKLVISILLAGAAASPAFAQDQSDRGDRGHYNEQQQQGARQQAREQHQQARQERSAIDRSQFQVRQQQQLQARQQQVLSESRTDQQTRAQRPGGISRWTRDNVQQAGETARWTRDPNQRSGETLRWTRDRVPGPAVNESFGQNRAIQQEVSQRYRSTNRAWNRNWRNDRRYDWHSYRNQHRSAFHLGVYYDPFGYGYRPFSVGYRLLPAYFGQQYWIDPAMYSLPYPPPGTQWIRYWNDALLVDAYTGQVVDVIQNFFW